MRPTAWMSFLGVLLLTAAIGNCVATAQARPTKPAETLPSWIVTGDWMSTEDDAAQDALDKAQAKVTEYLRSRTPPLEWTPDRTYMQQKLLNDLAKNDAELGWKDAAESTLAGHKVAVESKRFEGLGDMRRAAVRITVTSTVRKDFDKQEEAFQEKLRQDRATARQGVLARVLAGLVALLAAVACYLRLEDATKGYYTTLLRVAAVAFVALVSAGLWLLT